MKQPCREGLAKTRMPPTNSICHSQKMEFNTYYDFSLAITLTTNNEFLYVEPNTLPYQDLELPTYLCQKNTNQRFDTWLPCAFFSASEDIKHI